MVAPVPVSVIVSARRGGGVPTAVNVSVNIVTDLASVTVTMSRLTGIAGRSVTGRVRGTVIGRGNIAAVAPVLGTELQGLLEVCMLQSVVSFTTCT